MDIEHFKYFAVIFKIFIYNGLYFNILKLFHKLKLLYKKSTESGYLRGVSARVLY